MSIRYLTNLALAIAAGFLVVATQAFTAPTASALTFAIASGATILGVYMLVSRSTIAQRVVGGLVSVLGAWTIVASLVFVPATAVTLGFASALAFVALGVIGLTANELTTERVVHSLDVEQSEGARRPLADRQPVAA
ncbi:MAG TPA: hypothetical protein VMP89_18925 [Solirubrobacteraceae bacterium]|nr:hypothetical protein [Solirubrobacteraceae bacterium]